MWSAAPLTADKDTYAAHLVKTIYHFGKFTATRMQPAGTVTLPYPCRVLNAGQPFDIGTGWVAPAELDTRLVGGTAQAAKMNLPVDTPGPCFIQPALHTLSMEILL